MTGEHVPSRADAVVGLHDLLVVSALVPLVTGMPVLAHLLSPVAGIALCVLVAFVLGNFLPVAIPAVLLGAYLLQNLCVSLVSPWIPDFAAFNAIRGYNFLLTAATWLIVAGSFWTRYRSQKPALRALMTGSTIALVFVGLYFAVGAMSDARSAAIYLRNIGTPLLLFQICIVCADRAGSAPIALMTPLGLFAILYGYAELLWRDGLYNLVNGWSYIDLNATQARDAGVWVREMLQTGRVIRGVEDTLKVDLLNTPLLSDLHIQVYRLLGPNFHSISYGYALSSFSLLFMASGRWSLVLLALPLMIVIGSKGALVCLFAAAAGLLASRIINPSLLLTAFIGGLLAYAGAAIAIGLSMGDYHAMGLVGGLQGFLRNPAGHGLGAGGNLSMDMTAIDWSRSQALGQTDRAVESAVGVLLFQMGVAGLVVWLAYGGIALKAWRCFRETRRPLLIVLAFGVLTTAVNGLLQEEALFSPLAMGNLLALSGLALGVRRWDESRPPALARIRPSASPTGRMPRQTSPAMRYRANSA